MLEVTALRASEGFTRWAPATPIVIGYGASFVLLAMVLRRGMPVGVAYGVWSAIGVAATAIPGRYCSATRSRGRWPAAWC